jgi:hypothetical protein
LFDEFLKDKGYLAMGGQIIDATIVPAPKQHNSREDNETIKIEQLFHRTRLGQRLAIEPLKSWRREPHPPAPTRESA